MNLSEALKQAWDAGVEFESNWWNAKRFDEWLTEWKRNNPDVLGLVLTLPPEDERNDW